MGYYQTIENNGGQVFQEKINELLSTYIFLFTLPTLIIYISILF